MSGESRSLLSDYEEYDYMEDTRTIGTKSSNDSSSEMGPEHCRTCYEKIDLNNETYAILDGCVNKHPQQMYHFDCIRPWFAINKACPVCWKPMQWEDILTNAAPIIDEEHALVVPHRESKCRTRSKLFGAGFGCTSIIVTIVILLIKL